MKRFAFVLLAVLTACTAPAGVQFRATVAQADGSYPMSVVLGDQTGLVVAIESATSEGGDKRPFVEPDLGDPKAVVVTWATGACDDDTAIALRRMATGFRMDIEVHAGIDLGCTAQLVFRSVRVSFSEAVPAGTIEVSGGL